MNISFRASVVFGSLVLLTCFCSGVVAQRDPRISEIRQRDQMINNRILLAEQNQELSTTFLNELVINKDDMPFPAVSVYRSVVKFYYTYGDRERNPYPDRLFKIVIATERSSRRESSEYLFNDAGQLILFYAKTDDYEHRIYFARERAIGFEEGEEFLNLRNKVVAATIAEALKEKAHLVAIFRGSLRL